MFRNWGFLLGEIWVLLLLAALIGLIAGWFLWSRREVHTTGTTHRTGDTVAAFENARLKTALTGCEGERETAGRRIAALEADLAEAEARAAAADARAAAADLRSSVTPAPLAAPITAPAPAEPAAVVVEKVRPRTLDVARDGGPDDLKRIKGIGPKMEALCHRLGFFHFDQIAAWTSAELAWVDDNLEDFKGRASRDNWIGQARELAAEKG